MKKMLKLRNSIIAVLCFAVICMAIGFSFLSAKLESVEQNKPYFNVSFEKVSKETAVKGGNISPKCESSINNSSQEINMKCSLYAPHDELSYFIVIKNIGNIPANIIGIKENTEFSNNLNIKNAPIKITHSDIVGKTLKPDEETIFKVYIKYSNELNVLEKINFEYNLALLTASPND